MTDKILRCQEVHQKIGLSRSAIYRMVERGDFPRPQKLGLRAIGWRESAVNAWVEAGFTPGKSKESLSLADRAFGG